LYRGQFTFGCHGHAAYADVSMTPLSRDNVVRGRSTSRMRNPHHGPQLHTGDSVHLG
ncbi:Hypothetical predicted protein, partial [Pelobates cultripes]